MELSVATLGFLALGLLLVLLLSLMCSYSSSSSSSTLSKRKLPLPPQPPSLPLFGHIHLFGKLPHQSLQSLSQKYGPLMLLRLGSVRLLIASSPSMAREILKFHDVLFASRPETVISKIFSRNGQSLGLSSYGSHWRFLRKICAMELFSPNRLESFTAQREEEAFAMLRSISEQCLIGKAVNINTELWKVVYNNICRMVMGHKYTGSTKAEILKKLLIDCVGLNGAFHVGYYFPSLKWMDFTRLEQRSKKIIENLDCFFDEIIEERRKIRNSNPDGPSKDFLDVLLSLSDDSNEQYQLSDTSIRAIMNDMFVAGTETSAFTTEWALAELLRYPRVMKRAQEEIDSIVGLKRKVCESDIPQLTYLQAILKENFRLHPIVPLLVPHVNPEDCVVAGHLIPAGTQALVNVWAMGRDPQLWENPLEFYPERFLASKIDVKGMDFELIPFGSGRRMCPGMGLGIRLVGLLLASLIQAFEWKLPEGETAENLDMSEEFLSSLPRAKQLMAVPTLRVPASLFLE